MEENIPLIKRIEQLTQIVESKEQENIKTKRIKIPRKAKCRRRKIKKGWVGVLKIDENGHISGEKQKVEGFTVKLKEGTYHATDGREVLFWEGKFPVIIQPTWQLNPIRIKKDEVTKNETYGQKYVMAKMLKDAITLKKGKGSIIVWIIIIAVVLFGVNYFMGGA